MRKASRNARNAVAVLKQLHYRMNRSALVSKSARRTRLGSTLSGLPAWDFQLAVHAPWRMACTQLPPIVLPAILFAALFLLGASHSFFPLKLLRSTGGRHPLTNSSIRTSNQYSPEELVRNIFVRGGCDNISNIRAIGPGTGIGFFENGNSSIGLDRGIILATGPVSHATGPNNVTDKSGNYHYNGGDPDLNILSGTTVRDRVGLEFDFVPLDSFVTFRYVFASEEYCEFVGSIYNDVFGFFISGPGINGPFSNNSRNIALIPGTDGYVSINSVNHQQNESFFVRNDLPADALQCNIPGVASPYLPLIQYDGFTRQLTAILKLIPCETYHLRMVVADVGDNFYDSAVFLEAESFNIGGAVSISGHSYAGAAAIASEGCGDGHFQFRRVDTQSRSTPITVRYSVSTGLSTAMEGVDFEPLPGIITIPAGQVSVNLPVHIINDGIAEPMERLVIELNIPCACYSDTATLYIVDPPPLALELPDAGVCNNEPAQLTGVVTGGRGPFRYLWNTGASTPTLSVMPPGPAQYSLTLTDACGSTAADSAFVDITNPPEAVLSGYAQICEGDTALLPVAFSGAAPWQLTWSVNGVWQPPVTGITNNPFPLPAGKAGVYRIEQFRDAYCRGAATGEAQVEMMYIYVEGASYPVSCAGFFDGSISASIQGSNPPFAYSWSQGSENVLALQGLSAGTYYLQVTDARGCRKSTPFEVKEPLPLGPVTFNCEDIRDAHFTFSASGGRPPYYYGVGDTADSDSRLFDRLRPGKSYDLLVRDASGCTLTQNWLMPARYRHMAELPPVWSLPLGSIETLTPRLNVPESLIAAVRWTPEDGLSCVDCLTPAVTALSNRSYTLRLVDVFGCTDEVSTALKVEFAADVFVPSAFSPNGDRVNDLLLVFANPLQVRRIVAFTVFDRWGNMLYRATDFLPNIERRGWDGSVRGRPADPGVYVYMLQVELATGELYTLHGETVLLR